MNELFVRTEDIEEKEILNYFVESPKDRSIIDQLKSRSPIILVGGRGVGKSFLMKVAKVELANDFSNDKIMPVYISFIKSSLVATHDKGGFLYWMLAKICNGIVRQLKRSGLVVGTSRSLDILAGGQIDDRKQTKIEEICSEFENLWRNQGNINIENIPSVEDVKNAVEDICEENEIKRIVLFIDEAAHIFIREQQAEFFTLFRDLRCPKISCKAAVYPGVTAYGDNFQYSQDATFINLNRFVTDSGYAETMREMVTKQIEDSGYLKELSRRGQEFTDLTYAASGNPRFLLNNIKALNKFSASDINLVIKNFYRVTLLAEHSSLSEKYPKLEVLIDWGRKFIEDHVLAEMQKKKQDAVKTNKPTMCYFWIHKDSPEPVKRALSLLEYTGIVQMHTKGLRASGGEVGTRYMVNLGCLFAKEANPLSVSHNIIKNLDVRRYIEFSANSPAYVDIKDSEQTITDNDLSESLEQQLSKDIEVLNISDFLKSKLYEVKLCTIKDVLSATESDIKKAYYVGNKRSRIMKSAALTSIYEYLIG